MSPTEIPGIMATLCSWESWAGPYHPQTLRLTVELGIALWRTGDYDRAQPLLERVARDLASCLGRDHELTLRAAASLRDLRLERHPCGLAC